MNKIINLIDIEKSEIKYVVNHYPSGQNNLIINIPQLQLNYCFSNGIKIKSRLNNWLDLEIITCATASLRELGVEEIHLYVPFIDGRQDRKFEEGGNNYLRDVLAPVINSLNFKTVTCIDPHSDVLEACIKGFRKDTIGQFGLFKWSVGKIYENILPKIGGELKDIEGKYILVSPDAGASKKIYKLAEQIGYKGDIITCSKERDNEGKLSKIVVPVRNFENKDLILIDDIGDGFGTFIKIAEKIKTFPKEANIGKLYLIVSHSIQEQGLQNALNYYDFIYTTNSFRDWNMEKVKVLNVF